MQLNFLKASYKSYEEAINRTVSMEWEIVADTWEKAIITWDTSNPQTVEDAYKILQDEFKEMLNNIK